PRSTPFPYTTLFRSLASDPRRHAGPLRERHTRTHHSPRALGYRQRSTERSPDTNRCDHRESRPFCCSLWIVGPPPFHPRPAHEDNVRRDGLWLPLRPDAEALLDRLPRFR